MIQVCDLPRQRQVRRLSAEEFFTLVRCGGAGFYRPCSEVLRMLTAGEAWGTSGAALLVLPLTADTAAAAALRSWLGRRQLEGGCLLTPPVSTGTELPARLVEIAAARADRLRRKGTAWAVVECTEAAAALLPLYFRQGFGLRALRPLESLAPCFLLQRGNEKAMKAVILESYVMEEGDLNWSGVKALVPDTTSYVRTDYADIAPRIGDAELVLINKCRIDEAVLAQCPNLKWVGIIATGTDNIDLEACRRHGVAVANVPGYSTYSVAQMTFSLLLAICQCAQRYDRAVKDGYWQLGIPAEYGLLPQVELLGKTFGIYGYGSIGRQTARIAKAFGMEVLVCTRTVRPEYAADGVEFVDFDTLLARSDVLSLHCPATPATRGLMSREALAKMKPGAILLNTARGALVDEEAVADALESGKLAFYGADAFATEPLPPQSRLRGLPGAVLTPHIAWTTKEALQRLMDITTGNLRSFLAGKGENIVNP